MRRRLKSRGRTLLLEILERRQLLAANVRQMDLEFSEKTDLYLLSSDNEAQSQSIYRSNAEGRPVRPKNGPGTTNQPPLVADDDFSDSPVDEDSVLTILANGLLANDSDPEGDALTLIPGTFLSQMGAIVTIGLDGGFSYDPTAAEDVQALSSDDPTVDSFVYTLRDDRGGSSIGTASVSVIGVNDAPIASDDEFSSDEQTPINGNVTLDNGNGNDIDFDDSLNIALINDVAIAPGTSVTLPSGASLTIESDGTFVYDPNGQYTWLSLGESASDSFTYTLDDGQGQPNSTALAAVNLTINGLNDRPTAFDDHFSVTEDDIGIWDVTLDNGNGTDSDPDSTFSVTRVNGAIFTPGEMLTLPSGAAVTMNTDGTFQYDPRGQFEGLAAGHTAVDSFSYTIDDGEGQANSTDTATVSLTIEGVNDQPTAVDDAFVTDEDSVLLGASVLIDNGLGIDSDIDEDDALSVTQINGESFVSGSTLTLPSSALLTMNADGTFTYDPNGQYTALSLGQSDLDSFTYTIDDGSGQPGSTDTAVVTITIHGVNNSPIATDDLMIANEDTGFTSASLFADNGLGPDADPDTNDMFVVSAVNGITFVREAVFMLPMQTVASVNADGSYDYSPNLQFESLSLGETATDSFTYTIDDGRGQPNSTSTATVSVTIQGQNDQPIANDDAFTTNQDSAITSGDVFANNGNGLDSDVDASDTFSVNRVNGASFTAGNPLTLASGALLTMNSDGTFRYDPNGQFESLGAGQSTTDSFTYTIDDGRGQANSTDSATVLITVNGSAEPGLQNSVTFNDVTFTFNQPLTVGHFVTGEPWVVSSEPFEIISISPDSQTLNGAVAHGAMKDPYVNSEQGFDEFLANSTTGGMRFGNTAYSAALNIDPGVTGSAITIGAGEETSIVKSVRLPSVTDAENWQTIEKYVPLHVLSTAPPENAYPPSSSGLSKQIWTREDLDLSVLQTMTMPASWTTTYATQSQRIPRDLGLYGSSGENLRRFRLDVEPGGSTSNYSGALHGVYSRYLMLLSDPSLTTSERDAIIDDAVRHAIQIHGLYTRGWSVDSAAGAGQGFAYLPWMAYGAYLLNDATLKAATQDIESTSTRASRWITTDDVGIPTPGKSGRAAQTYFPEHVGMPHIEPDEANSQIIEQRYGNIAMGGTLSEVTAILLLDGGEDVFLAGGSYDNSNQRAAAMAVLHRGVTHVPAPGLSDDLKDLFEIGFAETGLTPWTGVPDQLPIFTGQNGFEFTAGSGSISWNIDGFDYTTEAETGTDFRYSLDGVQWVEVPGVSAIDSHTGLMHGAEYWGGLRKNSVSGSGPWSANYPLSTPIDSGNNRNVVTTTGSSTNSAPSFSVQPVVHARPYPQWGGWLWEPTSGHLAADEVELACGVGMQEGSVYPAPTYTYQWKRDGVNIAGATSQTYTRTAADANTNLVCEVIATNSSGSVSATTAIVTAPPLNELPATQLIDTDFGYEFSIDYEAELTNARVGNARSEPVHLPGETLGGLSGINPGALLANNSRYGWMELDLKNSAIAGKTYNVTAQVAVPDPSQQAIDFSIRNGAGEELYSQEIRASDIPTLPGYVNLSAQIVVAPGETDLDWHVRVQAPLNKFDAAIYLTHLSIEEL